MPPPVSVVILTGVSGSGKTTLGQALSPALARRTGQPWTFADADDFHSPEALHRMSQGRGLTDADRAPWLARLTALIRARLEAGPPLVLACSALRAAYRKTLHADDPRVATIWLDAPADVLAERLKARLAATPNPVGASLLPSQFATLEPPSRALRLDALRPVEALVRDAEAYLTR